MLTLSARASALPPPIFDQPGSSAERRQDHPDELL